MGLRAPVLWFALSLAALGQQSDRQVFWQRTLEDALAVAAAESKPIFVAVNMDGESASDRIVHERYRDPEFVAATRGCVCLVASLFRHSPRDYDERGRRIPCPRLGEVTCGEHIALEPLLYDKYLSDGDRVAPRHALILPDGKKAWDLSLSFDLRDVDARLRGSVGAAASRPPGGPETSASRPSSSAWDALAMRRDHRGRAELEQALGIAGDGERIAALESIKRFGDPGSADALRILMRPWRGKPVLAGVIEAARALDLQGALARILRDEAWAPGRDPPGLDLPRCDDRIELLAELDPSSAKTRSLILVRLALGELPDRVREAARRVLGDRTLASVEAALEVRRPVRVDELLAAASALNTRARSAADSRTDRAFPWVGPITDAMPDSRALRDEAADLAVRAAAADARPQVWARYAKTSLDLGRRELEAGEPAAKASFELAESWFQRALDADPSHADWWIERARAAYFLGDWGSEAAHGRRAVQALLPSSRAETRSDAWPSFDPVEIEALRWIGDGAARLIAERFGEMPGPDVALLLEGLKTLGIVAVSPYGDANDWAAFGSLLGTVGCARGEIAVLREAAFRLSTSPEMRDQLNRALWSHGWIELAPGIADEIAGADPSGATASFAGYAWLLLAEDRRRSDEPAGAVQAYVAARRRYERALELEPVRRETFTLPIALAWMGEGMALLLRDGRPDAADRLVRAVEADPRVASGRDGIGYDVLDLVDRVLEWRESGPSPVDPAELLRRLESVDPGNPFWAVAISDAELREALRADGRNPDKVERATVDASGKAVRMPMGLPTAEGDGYLRASIDAARRACTHADSVENRRLLAQSLTIGAERMLERERIEEARAPLGEAASLLEIDPAPLLENVSAGAEKIRSLLGPARPRFRPGR